MRIAKWLSAAALILTTAAACTTRYDTSRVARDSSDYGDSHAYRYYAGPGADIVPPLSQR